MALLFHLGGLQSEGGIQLLRREALERRGGALQFRERILNVCREEGSNPQDDRRSARIRRGLEGEE